MFSQPPDDNHVQPLLCSRAEATTMLNVSQRTVDTLRKRGDLPYVRIDSRVMFRVADIHRYIESAVVNGETEA